MPLTKLKVVYANDGRKKKVQLIGILVSHIVALLRILH